MIKLDESTWLACPFGASNFVTLDPADTHKHKGTIKDTHQAVPQSENTAMWSITLMPNGRNALDQWHGVGMMHN